MYINLVLEADQPNSQSKPNVLCVGMACVDFVNIVDDFPKEDSDQRIQNYYWQRGGNASNNCTVFSQMSIPCEFMGVLGNEGAEASWIKQDFKTFDINTNHCPVQGVHCPVATVILNQKNGTRTILFFPRDRPELSFEDFQMQLKNDFSSYSWIHFEMCSNVSEISKMIDHVLYSKKDHQVVSIEIEKLDFKHYDMVINKADVVFLSKDYAVSQGFKNATDAVKGLYTSCKTGAILLCAWGDKGAALCIHNVTITSPALTGIKIIDTLGAGDTFVAGFIGSLLNQGFSWVDYKSNFSDAQTKKVELALNYACHLAGLKCSMYGYTGLRDSCTKNYNTLI